MALLTPVSLRPDGLYWPDSDHAACYTWTQTELAHVDHMIESCDHHTCVIHAGANVGAYALKFGEVFQTVYAFEPDRTNFKCLSLNVLDHAHIWPMCAALGENTGTVNLTNPNQHNCGTWQVCKQAGTVPMITIDSLKLLQVSCIHLDMEGYELYALQGASVTLKQCKPLVVVEWLDHGASYGYTPQDVTNFLCDLGYTRMRQIGSDMMFKP